MFCSLKHDFVRSAWEVSEQVGNQAHLPYMIDFNSLIRRSSLLSSLLGCRSRLLSTMS